MNAYTLAVRTQDANARILAAAKKLAPRYNANDQLVALENVKDKDPQAEQVKRLEAVADLLEQIVQDQVERLEAIAAQMKQTGVGVPPHVDTPSSKPPEPISVEMPASFRKGRR